VNQLFEILARCVYASGIAFVGFPWVHDLPTQKRIEFTILGVVMILVMLLLQVIVRNRQKRRYR
jgi:hypothetical protein